MDQERIQNLGNEICRELCTLSPDVMDQERIQNLSNEIRDTYIRFKKAYLHMQNTKQLNVKLPSDLYALILKSGRSRKDVIIDALNMYFYVNEHNQNVGTQRNNETADTLISQLGEKDRQISELHIMLQNAINQKLIPAPEDQHKKSWWKFWN